MLSSSFLERVVGSLMAVVLPILLVIVLFPYGASAAQYDEDVPESAAQYEQRLFDTRSPMSVDIIMDDSSWRDLVDNATKKTWHTCDVVVNGTRFNDVGIRTKGDSSLSGVAEAGSTRFSLKLKFDKHVRGQTCWGLDTLCLNNCHGDATYMKEAFVYDMFSFLGATASRCNYAKVMVNGNYRGLYLAVETPGKSLIKRCYAGRDAHLYKPGSNDEQDLATDDGATDTDGDWRDTGSDGADLNYAGDALSDYESIWNGQVTKSCAADWLRVVEALKAIGEKRDLETYLDMDNVLKYMAVHNFSVNLNSLSGDGYHNYYLAEAGGRLSLIPWDYSLCLGGYEPDTGTRGDGSPDASASAIVNAPIDDPWALTSFFDGILENDEYRARYHEYYRQLVNGYVLGGGFERFYAHTRDRIDALVRDDPTALYDYASYDRAAQTLMQVVTMRGKSVAGQLAGTVPSTTDAQRAHPELLVDAGTINPSIMGFD